MEALLGTYVLYLNIRFLPCAELLEYSQTSYNYYCNAMFTSGNKKASWYHNPDYEEIQFLPDMVCDVCLFMHKIAISQEKSL